MKSELLVRWTVLALLALPACHAALAAPASAPAPKWDARFYNPKPADGDIVLPLPCDGAIVFRKVVVPVGGPLVDLPIQVGQEGGAYSFVEKSRPAFIAGGFTEVGADKKSKSSYYLMAKYELTTTQYLALSTLGGGDAAKCPNPEDADGRFPATDANWFDALRTAHLYNVWLRQHAKNILPKEDGVSGFVRLPTEVEWEFAARGGIKVDAAQFAEPRYPMPEGKVNQYEWFGGTQSSNGKVNRIGVLLPNPLGLHDMLGNVSEMTLDAFRLNKFDRQYGAAGSYVIRGSDYMQPESDLRAALRREGNLYDEDGDIKEKTVGFRWVITSREMTSAKHVKALEESYKKLGDGHVSSDPSKKGASAVNELNTLAGTVTDKKLKEQLAGLEGKLRASNQQQEEARDQAIRASLNLGAFLCTKLKDDGEHRNLLRDVYRSTCEDGKTDATCERRKQLLSSHERRVEGVTQYYASSLVDAATLYGQENLARQVPVLDKMFEQNKQLNGLRPYLVAYWAHQKAYLGDKKIDRSAWLDSCIAINK
ncbi:formylglycine-generating enzyme family protein [Achromobacter ruhlandii]|uniref:formylglycine-generating enzyme family protein n=1 Tax=Achromobacter ruhlandii TaxID=72557 RepID=UPI0018E25C7A|nr:SUMF1/EgtB/PvdO family nonheme iron enzyme [Achromobacter ruhlandii]